MMADEFVAQLMLCAPQVDELYSIGFSQEEAKRFIESYVCLKRADPIEVSNPLLQLVSAYDTSKIEIGMVHFLSAIVENGGSWQIGQVEIDPLVIDKASEEVCVVNGSNAENILWNCAQNAGKFLESILPAACFLGRCSYDEILANDLISKRKQVEVCANIAGGSRFRNFYLMLLGCE
jgi:hypothetical protein